MYSITNTTHCKKYWQFFMKRAQYYSIRNSPLAIKRELQPVPTCYKLIKNFRHQIIRNAYKIQTYLQNIDHFITTINLFLQILYVFIVFIIHFSWTFLFEESRLQRRTRSSSRARHRSVLLTHRLCKVQHMQQSGIAVQCVLVQAMRIGATGNTCLFVLIPILNSNANSRNR